MVFVSPHSIAMPKSLYFTAVVSSSSFSRRLISEVTERISTKLGHIFTYDCCLKIWSELPRAFIPYGLVAKKRFLGPTLNFDRPYLCNGTWYQQSQKSYQSTGTSLHMPPNLVNLGPETAENGWRVLPPPLNFRIRTHCRPYRMCVI